MATQPNLRCAPPPTFVPHSSAVEASRYEQALSKLLVGYIFVGIVHMLLPGTLAGVMNLFTISSAHAASSASANWVQSHGFAQIFGWIGSFILGIGFYSIPKLRGGGKISRFSGWMALLLWTAGVDLYWVGLSYEWHWRLSLPIGAALQLVAFLIFFRFVIGHRATGNSSGASLKWIVAVVAGTLGLMCALVMRLMFSAAASLHGSSPVIAPSANLALILVSTWGFLVPFIWGFSARWLPAFLAVRAPRYRLFLLGVLLNTGGVALGATGHLRPFALLVGTASILLPVALGLFEPTVQQAKTRGVHSSFPFFVRLAYLWAIVAVGIGAAASFHNGDAAGIWGASRHALTVGFVSTMVFAIGQRVLPAFAGMKHLFSTRLMFVSLLLLAIGCTLRVSSEILAYQHTLTSAWAWLPVSATIELSAVAVFAVNLMASLLRAGPQVNTSKF